MNKNENKETINMITIKRYKLEALEKACKCILRMVENLQEDTDDVSKEIETDTENFATTNPEATAEEINEYRKRHWRYEQLKDSLKEIEGYKAALEAILKLVWGEILTPF